MAEVLAIIQHHVLPLFFEFGIRRQRLVQNPDTLRIREEDQPAAIVMADGAHIRELPVDYRVCRVGKAHDPECL